MKKFACLLLSIALISSMNITAHATKPHTAENTSQAIEQFADQYGIDFSTMTVNELNQYIDTIASNSSSMTTEERSSGISGAWLAAAQIARDNGYDCAATMVEYSVSNLNYREIETVYGNDTPVIDKLKTTSAYQNYLDSIDNYGTDVAPDSFVISKSDNADLFYALHKVEVTATGSGSFQLQEVYIHDKFDFSLDNNYEDLFSTLVNNWAWLCQQTSVLYPINIDLYIHFF